MRSPALIFLLFASVLVNRANAVSYGKSKCQILMAIIDPANHKDCLRQGGVQIKNPEDKKVYYKKIEEWNPPKGLNITKSSYLTEVSINRKFLADFAWLSLKPAILYWNGRILTESSPHASLNQTIEDLMGQLHASKSAGNFWLPSAMAEANPSEQTAHEVLFFLTVSNGSPEIESCTLGIFGCKSTPNIYLGDYHFADSFLNSSYDHREDPKYKPTVECDGSRAKQYDYNVDWDNYKGPMTWRPTGDKDKFIVQMNVSGKKTSLLLEYSQAELKQIDGLERASGYCNDPEVKSGTCLRAYDYVNSHCPELKDYLAHEQICHYNEETFPPECSGKTGNELKTCQGGPWSAKPQSSACNKCLRQYFEKNLDPIATGLRPKIHLCEDPDCHTKVLLYDNPEKWQNLAGALFGDKANPGDYTDGFLKLLEMGSAPRVISACQNSPPCLQDIANLGFPVCGLSDESNAAKKTGVVK